MLQSRKQKCLEIEAYSTKRDVNGTIPEERNSSEKYALSTCQALIQRVHPCKRVKSRHQVMAVKSQSMRTSKLEALPSAAAEQTTLHFTKRKSRSGPGEPSRPYYCVRVSQSDNRKF